MCVCMYMCVCVYWSVVGIGGLARVWALAAANLPRLLVTTLRDP